MRVWIDQDLCTGDGLCEEICPAVFELEDDGLSYVKDGNGPRNEPRGAAAVVAVPTSLEPDVLDAAEDCPGECIFVAA